MPTRRSSSSNAGAARVAAFAGALLVTAMPARALAQACCAGGTAVTPGRLAPHEDLLLGFQEKAGSVLGSYFQNGQYFSQLAGTTELDFEEDLFGAARFLDRGQVALLVPFIETRRANPQQGAQLGGGVGDINLSARYDVVLAGESHWLPGIGVLAGVTAPTGRPAEIANPIDATGIGAFQLNAALALEQTWGPWSASAYGIVAQRTQHGNETLGTQFTFLAAGAYVFENDDTLALSASYAFEGNGTSSAGPVQSANAVTTVTLTGLLPLNDNWRLLGGLYVNPPFDALGSNHPCVAGFTYTIIRTWA